MVRRRGIGASVAAALVFSTILLSNFALLASADQRERLSITADSESILGDNGSVLAGSEALEILAGLQNQIAARVFPCSGALGEVAQLIGGMNITHSMEGVTVTAWAVAGNDANIPDNLSIVRPFNGSLQGDINLDLGIRWEGSSPLGDVVFGKTEHHQVNLPVLLDRLSLFCLSSVGEIRALLTSEIFPSCNASAVGPSVAALASILRAAAVRQGFGFSFDFQTISSSGCSVEFACQVEQTAVPGPDGTFSVRLERYSTQPVQTA